MKSPPPTGPVTIVWKGALAHGMWRGGTIRSWPDGTLIRANVERRLEGIVWCREHVSGSSDEGKALLAAASMEGDPPMTERAQQLMEKFWKAWPDMAAAVKASKR